MVDKHDLAEEPDDFIDNDDDQPRPGNKDQNTSQQLYLASFKDFMLKEDLLRAVKEAGFEKPSEVQYRCINDALTGKDLLVQAKAGTGKTAVFALSVLNQLTKEAPPVSCLVLCHARELAYQIQKEFLRLGKYMNFKTSVYYGGVPIEDNIRDLNNNKPHIVVGTPGRIRDLLFRKRLNLDQVKHFVIDECDRVLSNLQMRNDITEIFIKTNKSKQCMMFSGTIPEEMKTVCRDFLQDQIEVFVEDNSKLVLNGLSQYYIKSGEKSKMQNLIHLIQNIPYNQMIIFVNQVDRAKMLSKMLNDQSFANICIHRGLDQPTRIEHYRDFKENKNRIMVATDLFGRGIDIERVNVVVNFDMPKDIDDYMHRVGRAGRFETKGMAISFINDFDEEEILNKIQSNFSTSINELPKEIDASLVN